jgi:hypothetical protein
MSDRERGLLVHIRPKILAPWKEVQLVALTVEPFGLDLRGDVDLMTRRPYPNKDYAVACRKGRKAIEGWKGRPCKNAR